MPSHPGYPPYVKVNTEPGGSDDTRKGLLRLRVLQERKLRRRLLLNGREAEGTRGGP